MILLKLGLGIDLVHGELSDDASSGADVEELLTVKRSYIGLISLGENGTGARAAGL